MRERVVARWLILSCLLLLSPSLALADDPILEVKAGADTLRFTRSELLSRPDVTTVEIAKDVSYGSPMSYRAVPARALLSGLAVDTSGVIEAVASDGFAAQIPAGLMLNADASEPIAWVAIEPEDAPWPQLGDKGYTAGPYYIVWTGPEGVRSEYWAYKTAKLVSELSPAERWPDLKVDASLSAEDAARKGQSLYIAQCLPCHKMNGAGGSDMGPDLNLPMNATEYMTRQGLHALIRNPKSVRTWPGQKMGGFPPSFISDEEIDSIIAYLDHMAGRKTKPE